MTDHKNTIRRPVGMRLRSGGFKENEPIDLEAMFCGDDLEIIYEDEVVATQPAGAKKMTSEEALRNWSGHLTSETVKAVNDGYFDEVIFDPEIAGMDFNPVLEAAIDRRRLLKLTTE